MTAIETLTAAQFRGLGLTPAVDARSLVMPTFYDLLGDSRLALENTATSATIIRRSASSCVEQLNMRPTFNNRLRRNVYGARAGYTSAEYLQAFFQSVYDSTSNIVFLFGVINDVGAGYTATDILNGYLMTANGQSGAPGDSRAIGGIAGAISKLTAAGKRVVVLTDWPQHNTTEAKVFQILDYNSALMDIAAKNPMVTLIDTWPIMVNPTNNSFSTILNTAMFQVEGVIQHQNMAGAMAIAEKLDAALRNFVPVVDHQRVAARLDGPIDGKDSTLFTNSLWNSLFVEAGAGPAYQGAGSSSGAGALASGSVVPPGWRVEIDAGMTVTLSTAAGKYGNDLVVSITATQAGSVYLRQGINAAGRAYQNPDLRGKPVRFSAEVDVAAGSSAFLGVEAECASPSTASGNLQFGSNNVSSGTTPGAGPATAYSQILMTPTVTLAADATDVVAGTRFRFNGAGSATINLRRMELRKRKSAA